MKTIITKQTQNNSYFFGNQSSNWDFVACANQSASFSKDSYIGFSTKILKVIHRTIHYFKTGLFCGYRNRFTLFDFKSTYKDSCLALG